MSEHFEQLKDVPALSEILERTDGTSVVLFNHDPWCPISARAHRIMSAVPHQVVLIDVSRQSDVTRELATRTGVRHESPQVIVIRDGAVVWSASHTTISAEGVDEAVSTRGALPD